ncbi:MAG: hypothetical protein J5732_08795 [Bacteroidaceae bacterium]|nr:hypothetical protein [Bacteroidaceae bacterium]
MTDKKKIPLIMLMAFMSCAVARVWAQEPIPVSSEKELRAVVDNTDGDYILTADIVCVDSWIPIAEFDGTFNGNGHTITYNVVGAANASGLFGTNYGTIRNLRVAGSISGTNTEYGGIAGSNSGTIENCLSSVNITSNYDGELAIGGIAGYNDLNIRYCAASGDITGSSAGAGKVGGIVGSNCHGSVGNCAFLGTVNCTSPLTGMVAGENYDGDITGCNYLDTSDNNPDGCKGVGGENGPIDDNTTPENNLDELAAIGSAACAVGYCIYGVALGGAPAQPDQDTKASKGSDSSLRDRKSPGRTEQR